MATKRLTKRIIDSEKPGSRERFVFDADVPGFGVKVYPSGAKSFVLQYGARDSKRRLTIGRYGAPWTVQTARDEARRLLGMVASGKDPAALRTAERTAPTVAAFVETFLSEHSEAKNKPTTAAEYRRLLELHILPRLGRKRIAKLSTSDAQRLHYELRRTPYQANRALGVLSKVMSFAETAGLRPRGSNPVRFVERYREDRRERFLSPAEFARLGQVLADAEANDREPWQAIAAIRLLVLTGRRRGEVLGLRWSDVDLDHARVNLADTKTGRKSFPLPAPAMAVLSKLPRYEDSLFVLPGYRSARPFVGLPKVWQRLRKLAGLEDVRLHDLRHSYASVGVQSGESLPMLSAMLGHSTPAMTARYAHLSDDPVRAATERTAATIASAMVPQKTRGIVVRIAGE